MTRQSAGVFLTSLSGHKGHSLTLVAHLRTATSRRPVWRCHAALPFWQRAVRFTHLQLCRGGRVHSRDGNPAEYTTVGEWLHRLDWGGYGRLYILALSSPTTKIIFWCLKSRFSPMSPRHRPAGSRGPKRVHSLPLHSLEDFQHVAQGCLFSQRMNNKS